MTNRTTAPAPYIGRARILESADPRPARPVSLIDPEREEKRYAAAFLAVRERYHTTLESTHNRLLADAVRFHEAILTDPDLAADVRRAIAAGTQTAEQAVEDAYGRAIDAIGRTGGYIGARSEDFREVRDRLIEKLLGAVQTTPRLTFGEPTVIVCERLTLDILARFAPEGVVAVLAGSGGPLSHAAIALASEEIPLVVDPVLFSSVRDGEIIAVLPASDGGQGPSEPPAGSPSDRPAIEIAPLVNTLAETRRPGFSDFSGIGLFRTEFAILGTGRFPPVDEQLAAYRLIASSVPGKNVCFRLYDVAFDKPVGRNPKHVYGARFLVEHPAVLDDQLAALLTLSAERPVDILVPMVETASDWRFIAERTALCAERIRDAIGSTPLAYRLGAMVETRRAIAAMGDFHGAAFFSIGSNDLSADLNGRLRDDTGSDRHPFLDPAFQAVLADAAAAAEKAGVPVSLCGGAADDPDAVKLAIRAGIRRFLPSVAAAYAIYPSIERH